MCSREKPDNLRLQCPTLQTCLRMQEMKKFSFYLVRFEIYRQKTKYGPIQGDLYELEGQAFEFFGRSETSRDMKEII